MHERMKQVGYLALVVWQVYRSRAMPTSSYYVTDSTLLKYQQISIS